MRNLDCAFGLPAFRVTVLIRVITRCTNNYLRLRRALFSAASRLLVGKRKRLSARNTRIRRGQGL